MQTNSLIVLVFFAAANIAFAQQRPANGFYAGDRALATAFTSEKLWIWQNRLNLKNWNISVILAPTADFKPNTLGNIRWDLVQKTAVIRVLDPADYHLPQSEMLQDMEVTIVHELIHLSFASVMSDLQCSRANHGEEEQAVSHLTDALLKLDRNQGPRRSALTRGKSESDPVSRTDSRTP